MRLVFLILLLTNVLLLAWGLGYFGTPNDGREPERLSLQLAPEKLRSVPNAIPTE